MDACRIVEVIYTYGNLVITGYETMGLYINHFYGVTWYKHSWYVKGHNCIVISSIKPSEIGVACSPTYLSFAGPGRKKKNLFFLDFMGKVITKNID